MANVSRVNGFRPIRYANGAQYNGMVNTYFIPSTDANATFVGDLVKADTTGDTVAAGGAGQGVASVVRAAAGDTVVGVVVGFTVQPGVLDTPQYRSASTGRYVLVCDDPGVLFEVQTSNGTLGVADVGLNANFAAGAGSSTTGSSGMTLDVATAATTATLPLKIMGFTQRVDNDNTSANSKVIVKLIKHQFANGVAGI